MSGYLLRARGPAVSKTQKLLRSRSLVGEQTLNKIIRYTVFWKVKVSR